MITPFLVVMTGMKRVVDGDTAHHTVEEEKIVRMARVQAPERKTADGPASTAWTEQWYRDHPGPYRLEIHGLDNWGRLVAEVWAPDGHNISDDMLAAGMAKPYALHRQLAGLPQAG